MNRSPIVEEIRKYREKHAQSCGFDLKRIAEDIRASEQRLREEGWTVVAPKAQVHAPVQAKTAQ